MKLKLKDFPIHLEAREYAFKEGEMEPIFEMLFYLCKLYDLDPKAVSVKFPGPEEESIFFCYLEPQNDLEDPKEDSMVATVLEVRLHLAHTERVAARFCGAKPRTLQRWQKAGLRSFRLGRRRVFMEHDLWNFMTENGVGRLWKVLSEYTPGMRIEDDPIFDQINED